MIFICVKNNTLTRAIVNSYKFSWYIKMKSYKCKIIYAQMRLKKRQIPSGMIPF